MLPEQNPIVTELSERAPDLIEILKEPDAVSRRVTLLPERYPAAGVRADPSICRIWELSGIYVLFDGRVRDALVLFFKLYGHMLEAQGDRQRIHKGMPLCWIGDCFG